MPLLSPDTPFNFIHVGKCGGGTVLSELRAKDYRFEYFHVRRPVVNPTGRYMIVVRDPLERFVSAFNWRKHLYIDGMLTYDKQKNQLIELRHRTERELLLHFDNANALAECLGSELRQGINATSSLMRLIGHVSTGFQWHLDSLLDNIRPDQIVAVICMERLSSDFERHLGFYPSLTLNRRQATDSTRLSEESRTNLAHEFKSEFIILEKLSSFATLAGVPMSMRYDPKFGAIPN